MIHLNQALLALEDEPRPQFEGLGYHTAETGSPLLDDCAATFDCRVEAVHDQGDEKLIVGHIVAAERLKETYEPLIYREEDY
jgi:flavin reductase (DIM6/NTAB) family NADH-FMN oxidoreductase RutF